MTFSESPSDPRHNYSIFEGNGNVVFGIEGLYPGAPVQITATYKLGDVELLTDMVQVKVSPYIAFSHESAVAAGGAGSETVYVSEVTSGFQPYTNQNNSDLRTKLGAKYGNVLAIVPEADTSGDRWWQDPFEIGYV